MSKTALGYGKSLKGIVGVGSRGQITVSNIVATTVRADSLQLSSDAALTRVQIRDSRLDDVVIGENKPGAGYFTDLEAQKLKLYSQKPEHDLSWSPESARLRVRGDVSVRGAATFRGETFDVATDKMTLSAPQGVKISNQILSVERIDDSNHSPSLSTNVTFVSVRTPGRVLIGRMPPGIQDGSFKMISVSTLAHNASYSLVIDSLVDPNTPGGPSQRTAVFTDAGQGVHFLWDAELAAWIFVNGGAEIY